MFASHRSITASDFWKSPSCNYAGKNKTKRNNRIETRVLGLEWQHKLSLNSIIGENPVEYMHSRPLMCIPQLLFKIITLAKAQQAQSDRLAGVLVGKVRV